MYNIVLLYRNYVSEKKIYIYIYTSINLDSNLPRNVLIIIIIIKKKVNVILIDR